MRNSTLIFALLLAVVVTLSAAAASGQTAQRIKFSKGSTSAVVGGTLSSYRSRRTFRIKVRKGQTLRTEQIGKTGSHYITIFVKDPLGNDAGDSDASCNNRKLVQPTLAGDYILTVTECRKADEWRGRFKYRVTVR